MALYFKLVFLLNKRQDNIACTQLFIEYMLIE